MTSLGKTWQWSKESKIRASSINKEVWNRAGYKERMSKIHKENPTKYWLGKTRSEEVKEKLRLANLGNILPKETREKIRDNNIKKQSWKRFPRLPKNWYGTKADYSELHAWVSSKLGKPDTCEKCNTAGLSGRKIHWANKSGKYLKVLSDWIRLCAKCHWHKDFNNETIN